MIRNTADLACEIVRVLDREPDLTGALIMTVPRTTTGLGRERSVFTAESVEGRKFQVEVTEVVL